MAYWYRLAKKGANGNSRAASDDSKNNHEAQISKGLMQVFMRATQVEGAMTDLVVSIDQTCNTAESEDKQLSDICRFLGLNYDSDKAAGEGGMPCFSGPEGIVSQSCLHAN